MAAAAAAAANIKLAADKQLETLYKTVEPLKDVGYHKFREQLNRQSYAYEWPAHILDFDAAVPEDLSLKQERDVRNAYLVIMSKTDGHPVENLLEACTQGDARQAFRLVHNHFHRDSQSGRTAAYKDFFGATMSKTDTNIIEWTALVSRKAKVLLQAGGQADPTAYPY